MAQTRSGSTDPVDGTRERPYADLPLADVAGAAEHLRLALDAGQLGTFRWDARTGETVWDASMEALVGLAPGTFGGTYDDWVSSLHPDDREASIATLDQAAATGGNYTIEHRVVWPDGSVHWIQGKGRVLLDDDGTVLGAIGCSADVTDQKAAELERTERLAEVAALAAAERANSRRFEFLGRISDTLSLARSIEDAAHNVADEAVHHLGDWCVVYVLDGTGEPPRTEVAHRDRSRVSYARELQARFPFNPDAPAGPAAVMRTGRTEFHPVIDPELFVYVARDDDELRAMRELAPHSIIVVPITAGDEVHGALMLARTGDSAPYATEDVATAQSAAARLGAVLGNLELISQQRAIATTLQQSLLPDHLPDIPGVDVAVRYWAAGEATEVGGDFYDVFPIATDRWAIVLGDVCGTGPTAAAVTGMARHTIRAAARHGADPTEVLRWLNDALVDARSELFCTALYATLERVGDGWQLTMAAAGHPLPILVRADGAATTIGRPGTLLGVFPEITIRPEVVPLGPGDVVVLSTDGITDVPPPHALRTSELTALVGQVARDPGASAGDIAGDLGDVISTILPIPERQDDIALVVVRIEPAGGGGAPELVRRRELLRTSEAPREARRLLASLVEPWELGRGADDAAIIVSELVANAVEHGRGSVDVTFRRTGNVLRIEVSSRGTTSVPRVLHPPIDATSGRGLQIVAALARDWGHAEAEGWRTVWAELGA